MSIFSERLSEKINTIIKGTRYSSLLEEKNLREQMKTEASRWRVG
jgi:hypothetical protein